MNRKACLQGLADEHNTAASGSFNYLFTSHTAHYTHTLISWLDASSCLTHMQAMVLVASLPMPAATLTGLSKGLKSLSQQLPAHSAQLSALP